MSKRRRASSASRGHEDDSLDGLEASTSSGPTMRKRKKHFDPVELCHQLYDIIRNHKKTDGSLLCDLFIRVPKRRQEPKYYDVVSNPIDLLKVQQKLKTDEYDDVESLQNDIELIVNNTKAFYKRSTQEYKDANELWDLFITSKNKLLNIEEEPKKVVNNKTTPKVTRKSVSKAESSPDVRNNINHKIDLNNSNSFLDHDGIYEELFTYVMKAKDENNKPLYTHFQLLPSKKKYPEYYEVIETPIDLKLIAQKIQAKKYNHLIEMERDLLLMCKNACLFNEPVSQVHKQAKALKQFIQTRKWVETAKANAKKNGTPSKGRVKRGRISATAALKGEESDHEVVDQDESQTEDQEDHDNPMWKLFETVSTATATNGVAMSEPFWKLPSRRIYPDYYREIKNPMSLGQIKRKLEKKSYGTLSEVAGDLTIMFENAKKYNITTSKLYKDAVKLQKLMQCKVQELLDIDQSFLQDLENPVRKKPGPKPKNLNSLPGYSPQRGRPPKDSVTMKKRLHSLAKLMLDFTCEDGRKPMLAFMEKPSKKLYPDYYEIIAEPIDFLEIESKIKSEQYASEEELVKDFKLMFKNCREFNEENSPIYEDANLLEKYLMDKLATLPAMPVKKKLPPTPEKVKKEKAILRVYKPRKPLTPLERTLRTLFDAVRDYREPKENRQLSQIFMKLPSKIDYPDYYEVIKNPIDLEKISHKLKSYQHLDDLVADITLMLDNACKYNEPDSQIYKDALVLQRVCFQTKLQLKEEENTIPDVPAAVQDIFLNLFTNVYNHEDDDGRCYSDSMADLPEHDEIDGKKVRALSLDLIKRRLDKGLYKRLDVFQEDFFSCMERARRLSRTSSQIFEDTIEMQTYFIKQRDKLCKHGELLSSPALSYTLEDAKSAIGQLKQSKAMSESLEEETETRSSDDSMLKDTSLSSSSSSVGDSMTCNQRTFKVGEFVYVDAKEKGCEPHILVIERLFETKGQQMFYGTYYLRPAETYHLSTRKFLEREVFKSDKHATVPLEDVRERCCVVSVKQYYTMRPEGFEDKDVYVCESRYNSRQRSFKKIKIYPENPTIHLVPREEPLEPKRVMSVFRERVEKHKDELAELEEQEKILEKDKPNVVAFTYAGPDDGNTYYEQFNTICSGVVKTGDYVYVVVEGGKQIIAQIDTIWETPDGKCYFRGPWFIKPNDIPNSRNKLFFKQEVFLSSLEDTHPLVSIIGKCAVLEYNDYIMYRPTEIPEVDVYICASMYDEINHQVKKLLTEGLRKYAHSPGVAEDEIYFFNKLLNPLKVPLETKPLMKSRISIIDLDSTPQLIKMNDVDMIMEDSLDGGPPSVGSGEIPVLVQTPGANTPATPASTKKKSTKNKIVTGYILYSREVRKQVVQNNPESTFGDISRIVGSEWKSLPAHEKQMWEERASKLNEENKASAAAAAAAAAANGEGEACASPAPPPGEQLFECLWDNCDYQFEEVSDLIEHCIKDKESQGHVQAYYQENAGSDFNCFWKNCARNKKSMQPFPNMARLIRHVRDMHINKGNGRYVLPENRGKNFKPSSKPAANRPTPSATPNPPAAPITKLQEPMFITVPPRPQRVMHSEAYIKYIEGLQAENKHISPWERTLHVTQETTPVPDLEKLHNVATWLGKRADQHDNVVAALWTLRNQLLKDTLGLHKTL